MKAKLYFAKLKECKTEEEFMNQYESMMYELDEEVGSLIQQRNAKTNDAIKSCILEIDNKYKAILRLINKYKEELVSNPEESPEKDFIRNLKFLDDGFKAVYVELHPDHEWFFDINKHKKYIKEIEEVEKKKQEERNNFFLHAVTPFDQLTMDNLTSEILACLASLGSFSSLIGTGGITMEAAKPLAYRIALLRYWHSKGEINLGDVEIFEKDPEAWVKEHGM